MREDLNLTQLLNAARAKEMSEKQAKVMEDAEVDWKVEKIEVRKAAKDVISRGGYKKEYEKVCFNCGGRWPHGDNRCPAYRQKCRSCGELNHFARQCKKSQYKNKRVKSVKSKARFDDSSEEEQDMKVHLSKGADKKGSGSSSDELYTYRLADMQCKVSGEHMTRAYADDADVEFNGKHLKLQIDSGSDKNVLSEKDYNKIKQNVNLCKTDLKLYPYNSQTPIALIGKFSATVQSKYKHDVSTFYVAKGYNTGVSLLCLQIAINLGVIKVINSLKYDNLSQEEKVNEIVKRNEKLFQGIGRLKGVKIKLHIDKTVKPVALRHRRVPFALRDKLEEELDRLEKDGIIESVHGPIEWVSPIVVVKKKDSDDIRMYVDMRQPNKAIKRTRHIIPTIEELRYDVNGAVCFSKLDLAKGFHQLELHHDSRDITNFSTHVGLKRFCCLNFGTSSASEIFHEKVREAISGIPNVFNIHDDILVYGKTEEEHNQALSAVFKRLKELGMTLKKSKCEFNKRQRKFFGLIFSEEGVSPDPEKVEAIRKADRPINAKEWSSFLGMASYSACFISDFATIAAPSRVNS